jgi:hypothetical protein
MRPSIGNHCDVWDFADELLSRFRTGGKQPHDKGGGREGISSFIRRAAELEKKKKAKIKLSVSKRDIEEAKECTFIPSTNKEPYISANSRYLRPIAPKRDTPVRSGLVDEAEEMFTNRLRAYAPQAPIQQSCGISLNESLLKRLEAAEAFHEIYRSQTIGLREQFDQRLKKHRSST